MDNSDAHISQTNPNNHFRIGLQDKLFNLTALFLQTWFADAFITLFGYRCYILTQCGINFSTFFFLQARSTLLIKVYRTISIKYNLQRNITSLSIILHSFFNVLTAEMFNDLKVATSKKRAKDHYKKFFQIIFVNHNGKPNRTIIY